MNKPKALVKALAAVTPEDNRGWPAGRPWLWAYGVGYISKLAGVTRRCTRAVMREGRVNLADPVTAVAWSLAKQGHRELAESVLKALGRPKTWGR